METFLTTYFFDLLLLNGGITGLTAGTLLVKIDLFSALTGGLAKTMPWSSFTVPSYTGYSAAQTVTPTASYISNQSLLASFDLESVLWDGPTSGAGTDVIGVVVHDNSTVPNVYFAALFAGPLSLNLPTDRVTTFNTVGASHPASGTVEN
jgi:hypothetical protein